MTKIFRPHVRFEYVRFEYVRFEYVRFEHVRFEYVRFKYVPSNEHLHDSTTTRHATPRRPHRGFKDNAEVGGPVERL